MIQGTQLFDPRNTLLCSKDPSCLLQGTRILLQGTKPLLQGTCALIQGTRILLQGTRTLLQGTKPLLQGTNTLLQGTRTLIQGSNNFDPRNKLIVPRIFFPIFEAQLKNELLTIKRKKICRTG